MINATISGKLLYAPRTGAYFVRGVRVECTVYTLECDTSNSQRPVRVEVCCSVPIRVDAQPGDTLNFNGEIVAYAKVSKANGKTYAQLRLIVN